MPLISELEAELTSAIERRSPSHSESSRGWRRVRCLAPLSAVLVVSTAAALAATGVIPIGSPVPASDNHADPHRDAGEWIPGTTRVLSLRAADPDGGPDWAMRVQLTTRSAVCIQAARVVDDKLGVLGQDGAFGNDGRFHPLPARSGSLGCGALDSHGNTSLNVTMGSVPASGASGGFLGVSAGVCRRPGTASCPERDLRDVSFGLLGRRAASITYEDDDGALRTMPTVGPYGAYLVVRRTTDPRGTGIGFGLYPGPVVRKVSFRDGRTCTFPNPGSNGSYRPCAVLGQPRLAYTHAQVAAPVRARPYLHRLPRGAYWSISVSFRARAAITTAGQSYAILLHNPRAKDGISLIGFTRSDIAAGSVVTKRATYQPSSGVHTGEVRLLTTTAPGFLEYQPGTGVLVGRFKVRIP